MCSELVSVHSTHLFTGRLVSEPNSLCVALVKLCVLEELTCIFSSATVVGLLDTTLMNKTIPLSPSGHPVTEKQQFSMCDVYSTQLVYCVDQPMSLSSGSELTKAITIIPHSVGVTEQQCVVTVQYTALQPVGTTISEALGESRSSLLYTVVYCVITHTLNTSHYPSLQG